MLQHQFGSRSRSAVFAPLGEPGRAAGVEKRLAGAIRSGILADGERLPSEPELAAMLGVATVTAREALVGLRSQGLIRTARGRGGGSFVVRPGADDDSQHRRLAAMSRVRLADVGIYYAAVLAGCAELAAERASADEVADLWQLVAVDRLRGADASAPELPDLDRLRHRDTELHLALAALTQSAGLSMEVMRLEVDFGVLLRLPLSNPSARVALTDHWRELLDAVEKRDAGRARGAMRDRVRIGVGDLAEMRSAVR